MPALDIRWYAPLLPLMDIMYICSPQSKPCLSYCCGPMWLLSMSIASLLAPDFSGSEYRHQTTTFVLKCSENAANHGRMHLNHYSYTYMQHSRTGKLSRATHLFSHHLDQQGPYDSHNSTADSSYKT